MKYVLSLLGSQKAKRESRETRRCELWNTNRVNRVNPCTSREGGILTKFTWNVWGSCLWFYEDCRGNRPWHQQWLFGDRPKYKIWCRHSRIPSNGRRGKSLFSRCLIHISTPHKPSDVTHRKTKRPNSPSPKIQLAPTRIAWTHLSMTTCSWII